MPSPLTPAQRLTRLKATFPEGADMARALSISVRAEPELVRQVRLILFADSGAELEADLYFSPFVAQRTPDWILLDPLLTVELQQESARLIADSAGERHRMARVRNAVLQAHASAPSDIACEEDVIWLSVEQRGGRNEARAAIEEILRRPLAQVLRRSPESVAVARWFASAARRMPLLARETQAFALLVFAASSALGGRKIEAGASADLETFDELARYLQDSVKRVSLWMALTSRGLHLVFSERPGYERVDVPLTDPVLLDVRGGDSERTLVQVTPGVPLFVPLAPGPVAVRTLSRDLLHFAPRATRSGAAAAEAPEQTQPDAKFDVFISYAREDADFAEALRRQLNPNLSTGLGRNARIWHDRNSLLGGDSFANQIETILQSSATFLAVVSPAYLSSVHCRRELEIFLAGQPPTARTVLPVLLTPVDREAMPGRLRDLQGYRFYEQKSATDRFVEFNPSTENFRLGIAQLAADIAKILRGPEADRTDVCIEATPDLDRSRQRLIWELEKLGYRVAAHGDAVSESNACVLLIGETRGKTIELALDRALEQMDHRPFQTYVWSQPSVDQRIPQNLDIFNPIMLDSRVEMLRTSFEDLVDYLGRVLREPARADQKEGRSSRLVYVMRAKEDLDESSVISRRLSAYGLEVRAPATEGSPSALRQAQRQALAECDAVLIYWGRSSESWVGASLEEADRARKDRRGPPLPVSIYMGPPSTAEKEKYEYPGVSVIHGEQSEGEGLERLARELTKGDVAL